MASKLFSLLVATLLLLTSSVDARRLGRLGFDGGSTVAATNTSNVVVATNASPLVARRTATASVNINIGRIEIITPEGKAALAAERNSTSNSNTTIVDWQLQPVPVLNQCQGTCRKDADCAAGLSCFRRNLGGDVPNCLFAADDFDVKQSSLLLDFCANVPPTNQPTSAPPTNQPTADPTPVPTLAPTTAAPSPAPTPIPTAEPTLYPSLPPIEPGIAVLMGNPYPEPLGRCAGDCDDSDDCIGDLICYNRDEGEPIPGCVFHPDGIDIEDDADYCIRKGDLLDAGIVSFRLKWKEGYRWQDDPSEQFWCMEQSGDGVEIERCDGGSRQRFELLFLPGRTETLIRSLSSDECLKGGGIPVLTTCDDTDLGQRWKTMNGSWLSESFEITRTGIEAQCLTQHHHPRSGEPITMRNCTQERLDTTSAWEFWW